ncbi:hypothetical protein B0H65DRAFT_507691 [Neurospora tetraspora]|uniref:Uncharacterized protein n=1 Tax=Neurospora tetraspora TaxID=94610 RepID=A0AAE0JI36_9PEZI|nr:hypothetical protein B0H65DRAFT_507691 [Neurospora tetraspora]
MDNTSDKQHNLPEDRILPRGMGTAGSIPPPAVAAENTGTEQPNVPEGRRLTRGMKAAGGVIPPVAASVKRQARTRKKPTMIKKEEPSDEDDKSSQGSSQGAAYSKKPKGEPSPGPSDPWSLNHKGVPDMDKLVRYLSRDYTKTPDDSDLAEAAHKYKWRGIGPGKRTLWELRGITLSEKAQARKEARETPQDETAQIKLRLCEAVFSHVVGEWEAERYSKWREGRDKVRTN